MVVLRRNAGGKPLQLLAGASSPHRNEHLSIGLNMETTINIPIWLLDSYSIVLSPQQMLAQRTFCLFRLSSASSSSKRSCASLRRDLSN
jgi:hypothetical protein